MLHHLFTLGVAYAASCSGYVASQCICKGDQGVGYEGTIDHSDKGIKCMDWKDAPNKRYRDKGLPANYCRNVNGYDGGVWCYTEDGSWGYCDVPTCDGRVYTNELEVLRYHTGWYGDGKEYRGLGAKVKPVRPLNEGERVRVRIDGGATGDGHWRNAEKKDDGIWEYSNWYWRTVGVKAKIEAAIFNEKKEQIAPIVQTYADGTGLNKFKTLKTQKIAVRTDDTYSGISASGNTVLPLLTGEHIVLKLDGKKRNIDIDRAGNWEFRDDTVRKMGEKVIARVSIYDKNGRETTAGWNLSYTGK